MKKKKPMSIKTLTRLHTDDMIYELIYRLSEMDAFRFYSEQFAALANHLNQRMKK